MVAKWRSIRFEILSGVIILVAAAAGLSGYLFLRFSEQEIILQKAQSIAIAVENIQKMIDIVGSTGTRKTETELLNSIVERMMEDGSVKEILFVNKNGMIIAHSEKDRIGKAIKDEDLNRSIERRLVLRKFLWTSSLLLSTPRELVLTSPVYLKNELFGGIKVRMDLSDVKGRIERFRKFIFLFLFMDFFILIFFGGWWLERKFLKPLSRLIGVTERIREGDLNCRVNVARDDEIGMLCSSFNMMIDDLKRNRETMENHLKELEKINIELRKVQEELIQSEKLASIGRLASGLAHEIGNPLGIIQGYVEIIKSNQSLSNGERECLIRMEKEIQRINEIVRGLLNYSRASKMEIQLIDVNPVIENCLKLCSARKECDKIDINLSLKEPSPIVMGDANKLSQVIINILMNAIDAMPDGGKLFLKTDEDVLKEDIGLVHAKRRRDDPPEADFTSMRRLWFHPISSGIIEKGKKVVKIEISDTGTGIKDEDIKNIFDPFFTTKPAGRGTGLGLSVALSIIESMGGKILVKSRYGEGSTFLIILPSAVKEKQNGVRKDGGKEDTHS